jgi:hypothetical protein
MRDKNPGAVGQRTVQDAFVQNSLANEGIYSAEWVIQEDYIRSRVGGSSERHASLEFMIFISVRNRNEQE